MSLIVGWISRNITTVIFTDYFLEEMVNGQLKVFYLYIACFLIFLVPTYDFLCRHFRSTSIHDAEELHSCLVGYCYRSVIAIN
jgi:hypothetical protein